MVGLSGKMGSGKDTAATLLIQAMPEMHWKRISFARRVKDVVATLTSTTIEENLSDEGKQTVPRFFDDSLGILQQKVGMAMRSVDEKVWIKAAFSRVNPEDNVLITDVRFPNEFHAIQSTHGGIVLRLEGRGPRPNETRPTTHVSETALDSFIDAFDAIIYNTGSLEELKAQLVDAVGTALCVRQPAAQ